MGAQEFNKTGRHVTQKKYQGKHEPLASINRSAGKTKQDINSVFSFSVQLYSLKQIINVLLQTENILEKNLRNNLPLTRKKRSYENRGYG